MPRLYLTDLEQNGSESVCTFDYFLSGIPVLPASGYGAEVRFSGTSIVQVRLVLRAYTLTTQTLSVLPPAQAAAILPEGSALRLSTATRPPELLPAGSRNGRWRNLFPKSKSDSADSGAGNYRASACGGSDAGGKSRQRKEGP